MTGVQTCALPISYSRLGRAGTTPHGGEPAEIPAVQPDRRAFEAVARTHAGESRFFFFDDRARNVCAASELGWQARRVRGVAEARRACLELGLLG